MQNVTSKALRRLSDAKRALGTAQLELAELSQVLDDQLDGQDSGATIKELVQRCEGAKRRLVERLAERCDEKQLRIDECERELAIALADARQAAWAAGDAALIDYLARNGD